MRSETLRLQHEQSVMKEKIRENGEKIKQNKVLPYLVGNVVEVSLPPRLLVPTAAPRAEVCTSFTTRHLLNVYIHLRHWSFGVMLRRI